jgi:hypothetical protein
MRETFVFEGTEVIKTGRTATREVKNPKGVLIMTKTLIEVTPVDDTFDWKKWVDPSQLYIVKGKDE